MSTCTRALGGLAICAVISLAARPAHALTVVMPLGGNAVTLPARHVMCDPNTSLAGWRLDNQGTRVRPPPARGVATTVTLKVARTQAKCATEPETLVLRALTAWPEIDRSSVAFNVDVGRLDVSGRALRDLTLTWRVGPHAGQDICPEPQRAGGTESCAFTLERNLIADESQIALTWAPPGLASDDELWAFDADGRRLGPSHFQLAPSKIIVLDIISPEITLDASIDMSRLALRHPEVIDKVSCRGASCDLDGGDLVVRGVRSLDEVLEIRPVLRPHVYVQGASQLITTPVLLVPLQHCPVSLASAAPLRGVSGQHLVISVGGRCQNEPDLRFFVSGTPARVVQTLHDQNTLFVAVRTDVVLGEDVTLVVQRKNAAAGMARVATRVVPSVRSRLELAGYGMIDFIPSNRPAELVLPNLSDNGMLVPIPVAGVYTTSIGPSGGYRVQGMAGATGWVGLRTAYRDGTLPGVLKDLNLAELTDSVDRAVHPASIPMSLGANALGAAPIVELQCTDLQGVVHPIRPAHAVNISFQQKDSCRLVLHRERLEPEDGDQLVRITVNVASLSGVNRPEAAVDQRVLLRPGSEPRYVYLGGVVAPFDRVVARVSVITEDLHESVAAIGQAERVNLAQVQWSVTVGNNRLRLYATTAMPTGLFRVADRGHSGLMGLSSGILSRMVLLGRNGAQAPIALELGVMVLGITGDQTPAPGGHVSAVGGLSLSVPIANVSLTTQAAISLHAWAEYGVSRAFMRNAGRPWGFVFGPSLSFGDVGVNL